MRPSKIVKYLGPREDLAESRVGGARHAHAVGRFDQRAIVLRRVADDLSLPIDGAVSRLARHFRAPVAVEVVDDELRVVGAGPDVPAEIDPPEPCPVQLVGVEDHVAGHAAGRGVARVRRIPLEHDLVLAVAIEIAGARVVRVVGVGRGRAGRPGASPPAGR